MGLFDSFSSSINRTSTAAGRATAEMRLKRQMEDALRRRQQLATQLGASLYEATKDDPGLRAGREALYDGIAQCDAERRECQRQIEQLHVAATTAAYYTCPFCGAKIGTADMFCSGCGKPMAEVQAALGIVASSPAAPAPTGPVCPSCGAPVASDDAFCTNCGARLESAATATAAPAPVAEPEPVVDPEPEPAAEPAQAVTPVPSDEPAPVEPAPEEKPAVDAAPVVEDRPVPPVPSVSEPVPPVEAVEPAAFEPEPEPAPKPQAPEPAAAVEPPLASPGEFSPVEEAPKEAAAAPQPAPEPAPDPTPAPASVAVDYSSTPVSKPVSSPTPDWFSPDLLGNQDFAGQDFEDQAVTLRMVVKPKAKKSVGVPAKSQPEPEAAAPTAAPEPVLDTMPMPVAAEPAEAVPSVPEHPAFCPNCGHSVEPGDFFCMNCGTKLV